MFYKLGCTDITVKNYNWDAILDDSLGVSVVGLVIQRAISFEFG